MKYKKNLKLLNEMSKWLFKVGKSSLFCRKLSFKVYRWSLPREFKHIGVTGPEFSLSDDENKACGKTIFWGGEKVGSTRPLQDIINSREGSCFIVGSGPSIKDIDFSLLDGQVLFGVNGAIEVFKENSLIPDYYAITDVDFFENRFDLVKEVVKTKADCFFSYGGLARICESDESLLKSGNIFLTEIVNREYSKPRLKNNDFLDSLDSTKKIINRSVMGSKENVVGFSKDMSDGIFCSRTILFRAIQIAYAIGFKKIYLLGLDLGYKGEPRFYSEGETVRPSKLDVDYDPYIRPSFDILAQLVKKGELEVYNLSDKSKLPESIIARKKFDEVISEVGSINEPDFKI